MPPRKYFTTSSRKQITNENNNHNLQQQSNLVQSSSTASVQLIQGILNKNSSALNKNEINNTNLVNHHEDPKYFFQNNNNNNNRQITQYSRFSGSRSKPPRVPEQSKNIDYDFSSSSEGDDDDDDDDESVAGGLFFNNNNNNQPLPCGFNEDGSAISLPHFQQPALLPSCPDFDLLLSFLSKNRDKANHQQQEKQNSSYPTSFKEFLRSKDLEAANRSSPNKNSDDNLETDNSRMNLRFFDDPLIDYPAVAAIHQYQQKFNNVKNSTRTKKEKLFKLQRKLTRTVSPVPVKTIASNPIHMLDFLCKNKLQRLVKRREKRNVLNFGQFALCDDERQEILGESESVRNSVKAVCFASEGNLIDFLKSSCQSGRNICENILDKFPLV